MSEVRIAAEPRTEFGKGAARRVRRAGKVPAVLYGHGTEPRHITLPGHDLMLALKTPNVLLRVDGIPGSDNLALPKSVQRDPIKGFLEHVDLLVVKKGEKVNVEVSVNLTGDIAAGGVLTQELVTVEVLTEATHIPEGVDHDIEGLEVGAQVTAGDLKLPAGVELVTDPETIVATVTAERTDEELAADETGEAAPAEGEPAAEAAAESGESAPAESAE
ncbi:50S ribosomal protein L25/general stress protein Ctc [Streptomonospora nanhaiensis]|uniref:Large ribosomal subunit protein bL25 n=1 Tax=Streptomonospora nanhaiensis TaxID=1323731 RepID=A0A853BN68_9ACTN|nr:50S ribosomal protein L25/general stress protein Ctc [Streptomonospora nanhaiensis]MBV2362021.1 50S ribosomal protein L25/general stress protein Ctc [Streptomonospora nanhaiensis]MBX9386746.1 50S ribosomal protein L25/general stress protein Ctc [Streptomonospora nanhaiensis]NYI96155.1 large subunit ribosomal protein L25 [Streptomonospora nanhaiensis]